MARKTILVSDLTGNKIDEKNAAQLIIKYGRRAAASVVLDVNADEVNDLASKGQRRGRRPKGDSA